MAATRQDFLTITDAPRGWPVQALAGRFLKTLRRMRLLDQRPVALSISFVSASKMKALNKKYREKNYVTDVLSFEVMRGEGPLQMLGDLVICPQVVKSQAKEVGHSLRGELAVLLCHGLVHLLGYDHERSKKDSRDMAKVEAKLLSGLKLKGLISRVEA